VQPPDPATLQQQLEAAHREEVQALQEAVALLQSNGPREQIDAAYQRCERARAAKNAVLRSMGKLPPR
jgi:hypothetical protein